MKSNQPSPVWPYLGILVGLFAIAVSAPRGWETLARRESIQTFLDRHPPTAGAEPAQSGATTSDRLAAASASGAPLGRASVFAASLPRESEALDAEPETEAADTPAADESPLDAAADAPASGPADAEDPPAIPVRVPRPERLFAELRRLTADTRTATWATTTSAALEELCSADPASPADGGPLPIPVVLTELRGIGRQGESLATTLHDARLEVELLRAQYALMRRVEIWEIACALPPAAGARPQNTADDKDFVTVLAQVDTRVRERPHSAEWRDYLLLDRLAELARPGQGATTPLYLSGKPGFESPDATWQQGDHLGEERRVLARRLLGRLASGSLSRAQRHYLEKAPLTALATHLHTWAAEAVDPRTLLEDLERHEETETAGDARRLADDCRYLNWSPDPAVRRLGAVVDQHYRNANVRLAVAGSFMNRLLPQPGVQVGALRDTIVGADVTGQSTTFTKLTVLLVPDSHRLRLGLEANGLVASNTAATSGPATFYNNGQSQFVVRKLFLCDARGLTVFPAQAEAAATASNLISLETDYDGVPLVGSMVRGMALSQHEELQDQARWETQQKVAARARNQLEAEITKSVDRLKKRFNDQVWDVLARLNLDLQPIALSTSGDRAVMRLRLAGGEQLGAFTPRPRAPSDSLMSLQVHESALNNALEQLELDGQTFTLPELFAHLRHKLNRPSADADDADLPENVVVTFAAEEAVRVSCQDGRVQVRISLAELTDGRRHWRDFAVFTHYRPDSSTLDVHFVRDGTIFLDGESLKGKPQITLRTIFSKVLSPQRGWGLLSPEVATDPRLADVTISQFTVDEGWIGLAYAPRPATGPVARKPQ